MISPLVVFDSFLLALGGSALIVGSITDLQKREVADWVNYGLLFAAIVIRLLYSVMTNEWVYLIAGVIGALIMFLIGLVMYATGQWGGGDAKMLMGLGATFGTFHSFFGANVFGDSYLPALLLQFLPDQHSFLFLIVLFVNIMIAGALYGIVWSICLAIIHHKKFAKEYMAYYADRTKRMVRYCLYAVILLLLLFSFFVDQNLKPFFLGIMLCIAVLIYAKPFAKAVEQGIMVHKMHPKEITEGEWVVETIAKDGVKVLAKDKKVTASIVASLKAKEEPTMTVRDYFLCIPITKKIRLSTYNEQVLVQSFSLGKKKFVQGRQLGANLQILMEERLRQQSLYVDIKRAEKSMRVHQSQLRVGDVVQEDLYKNRLVVVDKSTLGIDRYQIALLQKMHNKPVAVKIGIPFIPAFLIGFIATLIMGSPLLYLFV